MNLCFVISELEKAPSGVVSVLLHLCENWRNDDKILILVNQRHWAKIKIREKLKGRKNIIVKPFPLILISELRVIKDRPLFQDYCYKIFFRAAEILLTPFYIIRLTIWLLSNKIDAVLSHNGGWPASEMNRWAVIAAKIAVIKSNVLVIHNMPANPRLSIKTFRDLRDKFISWCCTEIITVSQSCQKELIQGTSLGPNINVIYNGINILPIQSINKEPPWPKDLISIGFVGELKHHKGVHILFESLKYLQNPCEVVLIGNGDKKYIENLKGMKTFNPRSVYLLGYRDDVMELYKYLDIVVLPSIAFESFGMVILESYFWGKPVICSDFGGMKEIVDHGKTGLVVPANDAKMLAGALDQLISNVALREKMSKAGRKRVVEFFSARLMIEQYEEILLGDYAIT